MKYGFIILNYCSYEETEKCIKSIEKIFRKENFLIVVIDNASKDGSYEKLLEKYADNEEVTILPMEENLGFSRANNIGYSWMKERKPDFLFVCNSDIEFIQDDFKTKLQDLYEKYQFHICGPDVFAPAMRKKYYHGHQSPTYPWEYTAWYTRYTLMCQKLQESSNLLKKIYCMYIRGMQRILTATFYRNFRIKFHKNTCLHGSCIILSHKFLEKYDKLFYPETKFYYEELLLYLRIKKENLSSIYSPDLQVIHLQGISSERRSKDEGNGEWVRNNLIDSAYIYLNELKKYK